MTKDQRIKQEAREVIARAVQLYEVATDPADAIRVLLVEITALKTRVRK
jgi:hypothetical protein